MHLYGLSVGKCMAGVVLGATAAVLAALVLGVTLQGRHPYADRWGYAGMAISFAVGVAVSLGAARPRMAWGRGFLACGLMCLCLICATIVFAINPDPGPPVDESASPMERHNAAYARSVIAMTLILMFGGIGVLGAAFFLIGAFLFYRRSG